MSEEKDTSAGTQAEHPDKLEPEELKAKLKDMGVMQDENTEARREKSSFLKGNWLVFVAVIVALAVWWWVSSDGSSDDEQAASVDTATTPMPYPMPGGPGAMPGDVPPPGFPPPYGTMPPPPPGFPADAGEANGEMNPPGRVFPPREFQDPWGDPRGRIDDPYGPPPGFGAYPPPAPGYYGPPPGYYRPAPGWGGYFPPPPGYYGPPPGYRNGYYPGY